jgi:hypothetical protein
MRPLDVRSVGSDTVRRILLGGFAGTGSRATSFQVLFGPQMTSMSASVRT